MGLRVYKKTESDYWKSASVEEFVRRELLTCEPDGYGRWPHRDDVPLEARPRVLCDALGRLMEVLMSKGLMTQGDFFGVLGMYCGENQYDVRKEE